MWVYYCGIIKKPFQCTTVCNYSNILGFFSRAFSTDLSLIKEKPAIDMVVGTGTAQQTILLKTLSWNQQAMTENKYCPCFMDWNRGGLPQHHFKNLQSSRENNGDLRYTSPMLWQISYPTVQKLKFTHKIRSSHGVFLTESIPSPEVWDRSINVTIFLPDIYKLPQSMMPKTISYLFTPAPSKGSLF